MQTITIILLFLFFVRQCRLAAKPFNEEVFKETTADLGGKSETFSNAIDVINEKENYFKKVIKYSLVIIRTLMAMLTIAAIIYTMQ